MLPVAAAGKLPGGVGGRLQASRRLAQAAPAQQSVGISSASTALSCAGCRPYDNRVQVLQLSTLRQAPLHAVPACLTSLQAQHPNPPLLLARVSDSCDLRRAAYLCLRQVLLQMPGMSVVGACGYRRGTEHGCYPAVTQVTNTERFPFSAVGELTGQLGATATTGLECTGTLIGAAQPQSLLHLLLCNANLAAGLQSGACEMLMCHMMRLGRISALWLALGSGQVHAE